MSAQPPAAGLLSPDGNYWWNGTQWVSTASPDGVWRWDGQRWVPNSQPPAATALPVYREARGRRNFVLVAFAVLILMAAISSGAEFFLGSIGGGGSLTADQQALLGLPVLAYFLTFVVTVVAFLRWLHRSYANLAALGETGLRFTPGWAVGWWFVPFANLVRPYQVMQDFWGRVAPAGVGLVLLQVWWAVWLLANFFDGVVSRTGGDVETAVSNLGDIAAAILAVLVVLRLSAWQEEKARVG